MGKFCTATRKITTACINLLYGPTVIQKVNHGFFCLHGLMSLAFDVAGNGEEDRG